MLHLFKDYIAQQDDQMITFDFSKDEHGTTAQSFLLNTLKYDNCSYIVYVESLVFVFLGLHKYDRVKAVTKVLTHSFIPKSIYSLYVYHTHEDEDTGVLYIQSKRLLNDCK